MLTIDFDQIPLRGSDVVLDLGCGTGRHSFEALKRSACVVALDLDRAVVADVAEWGAAIASAGDGARANLLPMSGDAESLPFRGGVFDVVIVSEVLEHLPDDGAALREIARVLKPGGRVAVSVPRWWPERVCWALSDVYHSNPGGHVRIYQGRPLVEELRAAGLSVRASHHAHALHSPYWWLKCLFGAENEDALAPRIYHRFLVWDIEKRPRVTRALERALDPVMGKSLVVYASKVDG